MSSHEASPYAFIAKLAQHPEGLGSLLTRMGFVLLLPLLEYPYADVVEQLPNALVRAGLDEADRQRVSLRDVVCGALRSDSAYWTGLAVTWLEAGFPLDEDVATAIEEMVKKKVAVQQHRHKAFQIMQRWKRRLNKMTVKSYDPFPEWSSLLAKFSQMDQLATAFRSPNPQDDHLVKLAIIGFSASSPTEQWGREEFHAICRYRQDMPPAEFSRPWIAFACLAFGHILGLRRSGRISALQEFHAEALLPGFMSIHVDEIEQLSVAD